MGEKKRGRMEDIVPAPEWGVLYYHPEDEVCENRFDVFISPSSIRAERSKAETNAASAAPRCKNPECNKKYQFSLVPK